jgi:hypothetical protein
MKTMGDMGIIFRLMTKLKKERKEGNMIKNLEYLNSVNANYEVFNGGYQLNFYCSFGTVAFYPSTNKWVVNGKVYYGTAKNLIGWIKNREEVK